MKSELLMSHALLSTKIDKQTEAAEYKLEEKILQ